MRAETIRGCSRRFPKKYAFGFADRIIGIDAATARLWGEWSGDRPRPVVDTLLAATAVQHGLIFVTRNERDVRGIQVKVHNPWSA
jgi:predicted nucleic acid-binding protein